MTTEPGALNQDGLRHDMQRRSGHADGPHMAMGMRSDSLDGLQTVLDGLDAAVLVSDIESFETLFANEQARQLWGDPIGRTCWRMQHRDEQTEPCDFCKAHQLLASSSKIGGAVSTEFRDTRSNRWYQCRARATRWHDGRWVRISLTCDITDARQAENDVRASEAKFRTMSDAAFDAMALLDPAGKIAHWNPAAERIFGYSSDEVRGRPLGDVLALVRPTEVAALRNLLSGQFPVGGRVLELSALGRGGIARPVEVSVASVEIEGSFWAVAILRDIARRKQIEAALRQSEERFSKAFRGSPAAMVITDYDTGQIIDINDAALALVGYRRAEIVGRDVPSFDFWGKLADVDTMLPQLRGGGRAIRQAPVTFHNRQGELRYAEASLELLEIGGRLCLLGIASDVTERRRSELALEREQLLLKQLLDLHDRERRLIAYEIHDGLAQQLAGASFLLQTVPQILERSSEEAWRTYHAGLGFLSECLTETRRLIAGLRPPVLDEAGVVAAIEDLASDWRRREKTEIEFVHNVRFSRLPGPLETAIYRVVQETLTNAQKHARSQRIRVSLQQTDSWVRIEVRDWGVGFVLEKVDPERFGLRGILERARLFGGHAQIESQPGAGTTVRVDLPLAGEANPVLPPLADD